MVFDTVAAALKDAWLVIEAVSDRLDTKLELFKRLAEAAGPEIILTTTSTIYTSHEIACGLGESAVQQRILNMHYAQPIGKLTYIH